MKPTELLMLIGLLFYLWAIGYLGGWPSKLRKIHNKEITDCDDPLLEEIYDKEDNENPLYLNIKDMFFSDIDIPCRSESTIPNEEENKIIIPPKPPWFCSNPILTYDIDEYDVSCKSHICESKNNGIVNRSVYSSKNESYKDFLDPGPYELNDFPDCFHFIFNLTSLPYPKTIKCKRDYVSSESHDCSVGCSLNSPMYHLCANTSDANNVLLFANNIPKGSFLKDFFYLLPVQQLRSLSDEDKSKYNDYLLIYNTGAKRFVRFMHDFTEPQSFSKIKNGAYAHQYLYCTIGIHDIENIIAQKEYKQLQECMFKITDGMNFNNEKNILSHTDIDIHKIQPYTIPEFENAIDCTNDPSSAYGPEYFEYVVQEPASGISTAQPHHHHQHSSGYNWFECYIERFKYNWNDDLSHFRDSDYWVDQYRPFRADGHGTKGKFVISDFTDKLSDCVHGVWSNMDSGKYCFVPESTNVERSSQPITKSYSEDSWKAACGKMYTIGRDPKLFSRYCSSSIENQCEVTLKNEDGDTKTYTNSFPSNNAHIDLDEYLIDVDVEFQEPVEISISGHKNRLCAAYFFGGTEWFTVGPKVYTKYANKDFKQTDASSTELVKWNVSTSITEENTPFLNKYLRLLIVEENPEFGRITSDDVEEGVNQAAYMCRAWLGQDAKTNRSTTGLLGTTTISGECKINVSSDVLAYESDLNQGFCNGNLNDDVNVVSMLGFPSNACMLNLCKDSHDDAAFGQGCHSYSEEDCEKNDIKVSLPENRITNTSMNTSELNGYALHDRSQWIQEQEDNGIVMNDTSDKESMWKRNRARGVNKERTRCKNRKEEIPPSDWSEELSFNDFEYSQTTTKNLIGIDVTTYVRPDISAFRLEKLQITDKLRTNQLVENIERGTSPHIYSQDVDYRTGPDP